MSRKTKELEDKIYKLESRIERICEDFKFENLWLSRQRVFDKIEAAILLKIKEVRICLYDFTEKQIVDLRQDIVDYYFDKIKELPTIEYCYRVATHIIIKVKTKNKT
jgi:hypothetical protein